MARAHRAAIYASTFLLIYLVISFAVLPIPLLDLDIVTQLSPVVRIWHSVRLAKPELTRFHDVRSLGGCLCLLAPTLSHLSVGACSLFKTARGPITSYSR